MKNFDKNSLILILLLIIMFLSIWIYKLTNTNIINHNIDESNAKIELLEAQLDKIKYSYDSVMSINDSINVLIGKKVIERIYINTTYDEKIKDISDLPLDSSISVLSRRLSKININK